MGISIAYDACRRRFLCRHREGRGLTFARTIKGPFGSCRVTSQIIAFPTSYRIRSTPPPRHKSHTQPEMQQFCANRLAAFRFLYERYFSAITGNLVIRRFIDKQTPLYATSRYLIYQTKRRSDLPFSSSCSSMSLIICGCMALTVWNND